MSKGKSSKWQDTAFNVSTGYLLLSLLAMFGVMLLIVILNDKSGFLYDVLGPLSVANLICIGPFALVIMLVLGIIKVKDAMTKKTADVPAAQQPDPAGKESLHEAETDLDVWTQILRLKDPFVDTRIEAVRELRSHVMPEVDEELTKVMLDDEDLNVRYEAYLALKFQGKDKVPYLLEQLKAAGNTKAKLTLMDLLRKTRDDRQAETLTFLYGFETDKAVRAGILESLDRLDLNGTHYGARDLALSVLRDEEDKALRMQAIVILAGYNDASTQDVLRRLKDDTDADIRSGAEKALLAMEEQ